MDSLGECSWTDLIEYGSLLDDVGPLPDLHSNPLLNLGVVMEASLSGTPSHGSECAEIKYPRKRRLDDPCVGMGSKACRERLRREKLNDRFSELSAILEPGRPVKTDKLAILDDAIIAINQLKTESQDYKETNERLLEEIENLKAEKNELHQDKLMLRAEKEMIEQQLKTMSTPPGLITLSPYQTGVSKVPVIPSYGLVPMWQYLPPPARDTSQDHELRPPAA